MRSHMQLPDIHELSLLKRDSAEAKMQAPAVNAVRVDSGEKGEKPIDEFGCNEHDRNDMDRMGKQQQLRRIFRQFSLICFAAISMATWEFVLIANDAALTDGGRGGFFWTYIFTCFGFFTICASIAEMSSIAPTAGGQYHWVSEFASPRWQQILSYCAGWITTLCWQAAVASSPYTVGGLIQSIIGIVNPDYGFNNWHLFLLATACTCFTSVINIYGAGLLPAMQNAVFAVHIFAFIAVVAVMWVLCPHVDANSAFNTFENFGGWSSTGVAAMIGQISSIYVLGATDASAHMAEEVRDAAVVVPRAIMNTFYINASLGLVMLITIIYSIPSIEDSISHPSGYAFIYILEMGVPSSGIVAIIAILIALITANCLSNQASTARTTFAFARDEGLPFSKWIAHVNPRTRMPVNAILLSSAITIALNALYLGSSTAFDAMLSLYGSAQLFSFTLAIACFVYRRLKRPESIRSARWGLGRWGLPINIAAIVYTIFATFWTFWPVSVPESPEDMNWVSVIFVGVVVLSVAFFFTTAKAVFKGPVGYTKEA
ncbi:amino acid permease-8 [Elsinoe australis]|uniref:Amino acid permease-8 n=1 Tax=Elsinoe australis TaxID=40998 RepID=A0A4U7B4C0_9PEZI|nr:amino acid permease-8 [Elsinoe australis]